TNHFTASWVGQQPGGLHHQTDDYDGHHTDGGERRRGFRRAASEVMRAVALDRTCPPCSCTSHMSNHPTLLPLPRLACGSLASARSFISRSCFATYHSSKSISIKPIKAWASPGSTSIIKL